MDDEELDRLLRAANPARTPMDAAPDAAAIRVRQDIIAGRRQTTRRGPTVRLAWGALATAAVVGAVVVIGAVAPTGHATAVTPTPLEFSPAGSVEQILQASASALAEGSDAVVPTRSVSSVSWSLEVDADRQQLAVSPEFTELSWNEDLSGHLLVTGGEDYWPANTEPGTAEAVVGGEVLLDLEIEPGQYSTPVVDAPGDSRDEVVAMLEDFGLPADPDGADVVSAVTSAMAQWTLTDRQHAALLQELADTGDVAALGRTTDRIGRDVYALDVSDSEATTDDTVLIDAESGRIVGVEAVQTVQDGLVPEGAVIMYNLWL